MAGYIIGPCGVAPAAGVVGFSGWTGLIPQSGLVSAWPFDTAYTTTGTATDPVGGKNATLTAVTLNGSGPTTHLNNAGGFNGSSSTGITTLAGPSTANFTISFWLWQSSIVSGQRSMANSHTDADFSGFQVVGVSGFQTTDLALQKLH
jgi:hypothetical protein